MHLASTPRALAVPLLLSLLLAVAARATTLHGPADIASLTRAADAVVRAKVIARESRFAEGGEKSGLIFTALTLVPSEQWKGEPVGERFIVRLPGGEVGRLAQEVAGAGSFSLSEEVVLFLRLRAPASKGHPAVYEVSHWALGKFSLGAASPTAKVQAMRDRTGVECVGCGPSESGVLSLDDLRAQVQATLRPVRK